MLIKSNINNVCRKFLSVKFRTVGEPLKAIGSLPSSPQDSVGGSRNRWVFSRLTPVPLVHFTLLDGCLVSK